ncbi:phosphotransferase [Nocardioides islandensis]|uniref:Phosphotransferase n=1 Tax=Nocardioides islandensis TaxID=433663 RepID=A0A930YCE1_9ACTN|nr:phosphotransferase [Nocardioides islandensis]MBF4763076.1 phosphotransferase [Nocardioides islandensis]
MAVDPVAASLAAASAALGRPVHDLGGLGGSDRSNVHRVTDGADTYVVKGYGGGSVASWARESVGLGVAGELGVAPRLLATAPDPPLVVMEDLGSAPDVAQHLLADDPRAADDALVAWARTLGLLHARTHADREATRRAFSRAEASVAGRGPTDRFTLGVQGSLDDANRGWATNAEELAIPDPPDVGVLAESLADPDHHALSPSDTCPDNNMLLADGCRLIDFEWAEVRHPAWDAAYLSVPWPTCWCSWRIPDDSADRAMDAYREEAARGIPYVGADAFLDDVFVDPPG